MLKFSDIFEDPNKLDDALAGLLAGFLIAGITESCAAEADGEEIETPLGTYVLSAGPNPFEGDDYMVLLTVEQEGKPNIGPAMIASFDTKEEAMDYVKSYAEDIKVAAPLVFKDKLTDEVYHVTI